MHGVEDPVGFVHATSCSTTDMTYTLQSVYTVFTLQRVCQEALWDMQTVQQRLFAQWEESHVGVDHLLV
jgi:hypothetical protein